MQTVSPIEAIKPISWLIGKWLSVSAKGQYPTIKPFEYCEEMEFSFIGQPMLNYSSKTWLPEKKRPMHLESGFLRIKPGTNQVSFMIAHNFGLNSLEEGEATDCEMKIKSSEISRMSFAKEPAVCKIERHYKLNNDILELVVFMETQNTPLTEHLRVIYEKNTP